MSALNEVTILELSERVSGEYCGKLLAEFGATVIKVEKTGTGSPTRRMGPFGKDTSGPENSGLFAYLNAGKQSVELNLDSASDHATLLELLKTVDVLIDDHGAKWLRQYDLAPDSIAERFPGLVFCAITAYGLDADDDRQYAEDLNVFHSSGLGYHTPSGAADDLPPLKGAGRFLPSYEAGLDAALCISATLYERRSSGLGQLIEISAQEVLASRVDYVLGQMIAGDMDVSPSRHTFDLGGPAGIFPCADGFAYLWMSAPPHWDALRQLLDNPAWMNSFPERWMELDCTAERVAECRKHITQWLSTKQKHQVAEQAQQLGLTLVAVNNAGDLLASPQYQFRDYFSEIEHPVLGKFHIPTSPYRLSATPIKTNVAPLLGQHQYSMPNAAQFGEPQ
ncbi:CaiB/BaiF CoA transferase family protein [Zhongshania aquimaris]|uniref:CoA transferase n=1 Tax=Zhongshania aquimaris TaxID=2857107 RepID=A0ABS6VXY4_9GAMM|nr:CoA transferase [Zhongshania aquimaris]MBW2942506.1 CoA transferase [Zhongshania aquimaris]